MKTIIELMTEQFQKAFEECGYSKDYARITVSNRPDLCEYQCNGAMAAAKAYKKAPFMIADEVVSKLADNRLFSSVESVKPGFINNSLNLFIVLITILIRSCHIIHITSKIFRTNLYIDKAWFNTFNR